MNRPSRKLSRLILGAVLGVAITPALGALPAFAVGTTVQTVTFTTTVPSSAVVGAGNYSAAASASPSGLPVTITGSSACPFSGGVITFAHAGTCTVSASQGGDATYAAASATPQTFTITKGSQTLQFTTSQPSNATVGGTAYNVAATATSGLPVSFTSTTTSVCTIAGTFVSFVAVGGCVIQADQAGNADYTAASAQQQVFLVGKGAQTVSFTSSAPATPVVGGTYTPTATSSSTLPVVFSIPASSAGVCSLNAGAVPVTFNAAGTCVINADQAGNSNYLAAPTASQSIGVNTGSTPQTVTFTSPVPTSTPGPIADYTPTATASGTAPTTIVFSAAPSSTCNYNSSVANKVHFVGVGTCTITATQPGTATNSPASATQSVVVSQAAQDLTSLVITPATPNVVGDTATLTTSTPASTAVVFASSTPSTCTVSATTLSYVAAGTCTVTANAPADTFHSAAAQRTASVTVTVGSKVQHPSITSTAPVGALAGQTYAVTGTTDAMGTPPITFTTTTASVCVPSAGNSAPIKLVGAGTCTVFANQIGNATYAPATSASGQSFSVGQGSQTISNSQATPPSVLVGSSPFVISDTSSSGQPLVVTTTNSAVCSASGIVVSFVGIGSCVIKLDVPASSGFTAAPQVTKNPIDVQGGNIAQTLSFGSAAPTAAVAGTTYNPAAVSTSGLTPVLSVAPASAAVCAVSGTSLTLTGVGTCTFFANQPGNATYAAAQQISQTFNVGTGAQVITITSAAPTAAAVGGATYTPTATGGGSGNPVVFTLDATSTGCTLASGVVSLTAVGTCVLDANQAANANYSAAGQKQQSFAVGKGVQAITFTSTPPTVPAVGSTPYTVTATGGASGNPVTFTLDATSVGCALSGASVSFTGAGTCVIDANQATNADYLAAPQKQQSFAVGKTGQTVAFTSAAPTAAKIGDTYTVAATGGASGNPVTFAISPSSASICSISGKVVSLLAEGTCVINANQAGNAAYLDASQIQQAFTVHASTNTIYPRPVISQTSHNGVVTLTLRVDPHFAGGVVYFFVRSGISGKVVSAGTGVVDGNGVALRTFNYKKGQILRLYGKVFGGPDIVTPYSNDIAFKVQ